jgi:hypothetical protein
MSWEATEPSRPDWGPRMIRFEGPWLYWVECQGGKWAYGVRSWGDLSVGSAEEARKQAETLVWLERHKAP